MIVIWSKEEPMQKKCTNSACRRSFPVSLSRNACPWCGKKYPRLSAARPKRSLTLVLSSYSGSRLSVIRAVRMLKGFSFIEARRLVDSLAENAPISVSIDRPKNLDEAENLLQSSGANYCFIRSRKRRH